MVFREDQTDGQDDEDDGHEDQNDGIHGLDDLIAIRFTFRCLSQNCLRV